MGLDLEKLERLLADYQAADAAMAETRAEMPGSDYLSISNRYVGCGIRLSRCLAANAVELFQAARERDALRERVEGLETFLNRIATETDWTIAEQMQVRDAATRLLAEADNRAATDAPDAAPKTNA